MDISKQKSQLTEMQNLIEISEEFLQIDEQKIGYQKTTDDILNICGAKYAVFNLFDEDGKSFITKAISVNNEKLERILKKASYILGYKIEGKRWEHNKIIDEKTKCGIITRFKSLRELVEGIIPIPVAVLLEKAFNIGEVVLITV